MVLSQMLMECAHISGAIDLNALCTWCKGTRLLLKMDWSVKGISIHHPRHETSIFITHAPMTNDWCMTLDTPTSCKCTSDFTYCWVYASSLHPLSISRGSTSDYTNNGDAWLPLCHSPSIKCCTLSLSCPVTYGTLSKHKTASVFSLQKSIPRPVVTL